MAPLPQVPKCDQLPFFIAIWFWIRQCRKNTIYCGRPLYFPRIAPPLLPLVWFIEVWSEENIFFQLAPFIPCELLQNYPLNKFPTLSQQGTDFCGLTRTSESNG
jgi:hypothetical protein